MATIPIKDRIIRNVLVDANGCWIWQGYIQSNGYGSISAGSRKTIRLNSLVHRESYKVFKGDIPTGLQIDHLCKVRSCANPDHLEAVTAKENVHRSYAKYKQQMERTHCPRGHEYTKENTFLGKTKHGGLSRSCRKCDYARHKRARLAKRLVNV